MNILIALALSTSAVATPPTANEILQAMHDRHEGSWYETLTFVQKTTNYAPGGEVAGVETWYESLELPGRLRIDVEPLDGGRILLFRNDSLYTWQGAAAQPGRALVHPLLLMGFDVYHLPVAETRARLSELGVDLSKTHETTWQGRSVWVIGADAGDSTSHQFWIDQERLVFVRQLNGQNEVRFNDYQPLGGGWIAPEVLIMRGGRTVTLEEYSDMKVGMDFEEGVFDPARSVRPGWITAGR